MWFWISGWFLVLLTVVGNGFIIYLVVTKPRLHTTPNWFILSLAVADLCCGLSFFPPLFGVEFGFFTIDLTHAGVCFKVSFTFFYCSNASVFAMTIDRVFAIIKPLRYVSFMKRETVCAMIIAAWTTPLLLFSIPAIFTYNDNPGYTLGVEFFRVIIFQIFPLVSFVVATCYLLHLAWKANRQTKALVAQVQFNHASGEIAVQLPAQRRNNRSPTILIVLIMTAFNVTYLGGNYRCICEVTLVCPFAGTLEYLVYLVLIANSAVNPIFYAFLKADIRQELCKIFSD